MTERFTRPLAWTTFALGVFTALAATYIGLRGYSPVLFADEWQLPMDLIGLNWHYPVTKLWTQHNEHRIPFQKLLELVLLYEFHGDHRFLLVLNWFVQGAQCVAWAFFLKRAGGLTRAEWFTATGIVTFCVFNPTQMQIFVWGFGPSFLGAFLLATVSLGALTMYAVRERERRSVPGWIVLAGVAAFLAECNLASGVMVWLVLPVCAYLPGLRRSVTSSLVVAGALGIGIYLIGYQTPANATSPGVALKHPDQIIDFLQAYFGESWHYVWPKAGDVLAAIAMGAVLLLGAAEYVLAPIEPKRRSPIRVFTWCVAALMVLTAFITSLGRQAAGVDQAREGRYQTPAMLFWCAAAILLILAAKKTGRHRAAVLVSMQILFCAVMLKEATELPGLLQRWSADGYIKNMAGLTVESGVYDEAMIRHIYPGPLSVLPAYSMLTRRGLLKPPCPGYDKLGQPLKQYWTIRTNGCEGGTETLELFTENAGLKELGADGWATLGGVPGEFRRVFATSEDERIVGFGITNADRWHLYAKVPATAKTLPVYALLPDEKNVCLLPHQKPVPASNPNQAAVFQSAPPAP